MLTAAGLLAVSGGVAMASPSSHHHRPGRHHDGDSSSSGTVLYVAPSATRGTVASGNSCSSSQPCTFADATAAASAGDTILVEPGTYSSLSGITIPDGVTVRARGRVILTGSAPIFTLAATSTASPSSSSSSSPTTGIVVRGFHFDKVTGPGSAIASTGASDVAIVGNTFSNGTASGIGLQNVSDSVVQRNVIAGTAGGISLTGTATTTDANDQVLGNTITDVPDVGIQVSTENGVLIRGNDVTNVGGSSSGAAIELANADQTNITVVGNAASKSYVGLRIGSGNLGSGIVAVRNDFAGDTSAGIVNGATSGSLNAMLDWWGCKSGPSAAGTAGGTSTTSPSSGCSAVSANVDWSPAATEPIELPPAPPLPPGLAGDAAGSGAKHADHPGKHHGSSTSSGNGHGRNGKGHGNHHGGNGGD